MDLNGLQRASTNIRKEIVRWRYVRQLPAWKLAVLQQFIFTMLLIISTSPYNIQINFDEVSKILVDHQNPSNFSNIVQSIEARKLDYQQLNVVFNLTVAIGMLLVFFGSVFSKDHQKKRIHITQSADKTVNITIIAFLAWLTLCTNVFLPLKHVLASQSSRDVLTIFFNPLLSIGALLFGVLSLPFSLVEKSPIHQVESSQLGKDDLLLYGIDPHNLFILNYNWILLFHTVLLLVSVALLNTDHVNEEDEKENTKLRNSQELETKPTRISPTTIVIEENITPVKVNLLNRSQGAKSKIRPVNVIKPLNVHGNVPPVVNTGNVSNKISKFINLEESGDRSRRNASIESKDQNTQTTEMETLNGRRSKSHNLSTKYEQNFIKPTLKVEVGCQVSSDQNESLKNAVSIGIDCSPIVSHKSQQKRVKGIDTQQQTVHTETIDSSQQCENTITKDVGQQSSPTLSDGSVQCELLSQERFLKLQQSALTLYKKTIQKQEQDYVTTTLSRKAKNDNKVNVSIQVDLINIPATLKKMSKLEDPKDHLAEKSCDDGETSYNTIEVQTDLFGYVLDKIIQERESSTAIYSKMDLDQTVDSVLSLSEPVKRLTESIRFKAIKSQHGVWYVSLRGDVFLTVARDTLRHTQINADYNIPSEIAYDVLRAMKHFVDNYNKLSDCFEEEDESDDESYINGFRL